MEKRAQNSFKSSRRLIPAVVALLGLAACQSSSVKPEAEPSSSVEPTKYIEVKKTAADDLAFDVALSTDRPKDGSLVEIRLKPTAPVDVTSVKVAFEGQDFPVFHGAESELVSLVVVPFNSKPRETKIDLSWTEKGKAGTKKATLPLSVVDGNYRSEVLKVQEEKINPPKRVMKRIMAEQKEIGAIYRQITPGRLWNGQFGLPIASEVTSPFGNKRVYNGSMKSFHQGIDLRARTPTPIYAPEGAKVALAKDLYFTGNTVILDHGYGLFTIYGHMSKLEVRKGEEVKKGQLLGVSGMTGRASGPHLHWGAVLMRLKFNPQDLLQVLR